MNDASFAKRPRCDTCQPLKNGAGRYGEEEKTSSSRVVKRRRSHTEDDGEDKQGVSKIAKALKRSPGATSVMAAKRGVSLSTRG